MSEQETSITIQERPAPQSYKSWPDCWKSQDQPWRTEPEIDEARQQFLAKRRDIQTDIEQGIYPFKNMEQKLTRADVEWLLATHESGGMLGPLICEDGKDPMREGLDLRGADLSEVDLSGLPLAGMSVGLGLSETRIDRGREDPRRLAAAACLDRANLSHAHLQYATLTGASLRGTVLAGAHMERVIAHWANMEGALLGIAQAEAAVFMYANLRGIWAIQVHFEGAALHHADIRNATLTGAHLEDAGLAEARLDQSDLRGAHLAGANLTGAHLEGTNFTARASLTGEQISSNDLGRIRTWKPNFLEHQPPADLRGVFFDSTTNLQTAQLIDTLYGGVALADAHYNGVNLAVVDWHLKAKLRDELDADQYKKEMSKLVSPDLWRFSQQGAVRAYRQLAVELRNQGMNEEAYQFSYRAQRLQRQVLRFQRKWVRWAWSGLLDCISGYGYHPINAVITYTLVVVGFAVIYFMLRDNVHPALNPLDSIIFSITSFHGRGFSPGEAVTLHNPLTIFAAIEAIIGLLIEITFIATFTQRFFAR